MIILVFPKPHPDPKPDPSPNPYPNPNPHIINTSYRIGGLLLILTLTLTIILTLTLTVTLTLTLTLILTIAYGIGGSLGKIPYRKIEDSDDVKKSMEDNSVVWLNDAFSCES
jgi:hypothetical protein